MSNHIQFCSGSVEVDNSGNQASDVLSTRVSGYCLITDALLLHCTPVAMSWVEYLAVAQIMNGVKAFFFWYV